MTDERHICPRCGYVVPKGARPLTDTSVDIWESAGRKFWLGKQMSIRALAKASSYSASTVHDHLQRLADNHLVERVPLYTPKNRQTPVFAYRGCMGRHAPVTAFG